jgi:hypothetical protein
MKKVFCTTLLLIAMQDLLAMSLKQAVFNVGLKIAYEPLCLFVEDNMRQSKSLLRKDLSNSNGDNLGDLNCCAAVIVKPDFQIISIEFGKNDKHLRERGHIKKTRDSSTIFLNGKGDRRVDGALCDALESEFLRRYQLVCKTPFPSIFPRDSVHCRVGDSEQKLLYTLERSESIMSRPTPDFQLMYDGSILVVYSVRNTCPFCNVSLGGFLQEQTALLIERKPSLQIKGIHVFYSFDEPHIKSELELMQTSAALVQPNITYTKIPLEVTQGIMADAVCNFLIQSRRNEKYASSLLE